MNAGSPNSPDVDSTSHIVLIHGIAGHRWLLWPLAWQLRRYGFSTSTFGYPSLWGSIERHAKNFEHYLAKLDQDPAITSFHVVAHSMGSIVTRQTVLEAKFEKLDRIVMLASPNKGSPAAKLLGAIVPFCKTLRQLSSGSNSFVRLMPEPTDAQIGIIAAQHDRVIPEPNSHLANEVDHITIFSGHNGLLVRPTAVKQIAAFLRHGRFQR